MNIISLFAGTRGLDLSFKQADFNTIWANEYDYILGIDLIEIIKDKSLKRVS